MLSAEVKERVLVTTVSTTTVTTVTAIAAIGLTAAIGMATIVILTLFLTTKELARAGSSGFSLRVGRFLNISIVPFVMVFAVIVAAKIIEVLA